MLAIKKNEARVVTAWAQRKGLKGKKDRSIIERGGKPPKPSEDATRDAIRAPKKAGSHVSAHRTAFVMHKKEKERGGQNEPLVRQKRRRAKDANQNWHSKVRTVQ